MSCGSSRGRLAASSLADAILDRAAHSAHKTAFEHESPLKRLLKEGESA
jgi:hypothetical protein